MATHSHPHPPPLDERERDILESELITLARLQLEALDCAQFVPMTDEEILQFERRGHRITEIITEIQFSVD